MTNIKSTWGLTLARTCIVIHRLPCTLWPDQVRGSGVWVQTGGRMGCSLLNHTDDFPACGWPASSRSQTRHGRTAPGADQGSYSVWSSLPPLKQCPGPDVDHRDFCRDPSPNLFVRTLRHKWCLMSEKHAQHQFCRQIILGFERGADSEYCTDKHNHCWI